MSVSHLQIPDDLRRHTEKNLYWKDVVLQAPDLRPSPAVASRAIQLLDNVNSPAAKISELVAIDPALTMKVLRLANNLHFKHYSRITSLEQAMMLIGLANLKGCILSACFLHRNRSNSHGESLVWQNSLAAALACREVARRISPDLEDEAYVLGLVHDVGKLALLQKTPDLYSNIIAATQSGKTFVEAEQSIGKHSHALIGSLLALKWNLPLEICRVIYSHHDDPTSTIEGSSDGLNMRRKIVHLGDLIAHGLGLGHDPGYPDIRMKLWIATKALGLDRNAITEIGNRTRASYQMILGILATQTKAAA